MEVKAAVEKLSAEWGLFKAENDRRLKEVEKTGRADPLTEEKVNKHSMAIGELQAQIDDLAKRAERKATDPADEKAEAKAKHRKAFGAFLRKGDESGLGALQAAISVGSDPEGGYAVPETIDAEIERYERDNAPMRGACRVIAVSNENYEKLVNQAGSSMSGWVGETEARPETGSPSLAALKPYFGEIYANPKTTQKALDDVMFGVEGWLAEEVGIEFAEQENDAFTKGNGVKKPKGILGYTLSTSADGARALGQIQKVHSGSSGALVANELVTLVHSLKRGYRMNASFQMSTLTLAAVRKLKDSVDGYLFQPSWLAGQPATLLGYPIEENDDMPDPAADANVMLFGDLRRAYTIVDVRGTRVLRDPYTAKPHVQFYTTKRVGGFVVNDRAVKVHTLSA